MAKNLSKLFGLPSTKEAGVKQHEMLAKKLKSNEVFIMPSMNRGYLVLRHELIKRYPRLSKSKKTDVFNNYLLQKKPTGKYIKITKV